MEIEPFHRELCAAFCGDLAVHPVPSGYAVSSAFLDSSGDKITFYIAETEDGYRIEDDGDYLATLAARDMPITVGVRGQLLEGILSEANAFWDRDTLEIRTSEFPRGQLGRRSIDFLSAMIRVRDLALLTRERVRSAFREDFIDAVKGRFDNLLIIDENSPPLDNLQEFPADVVLRPINDNARIGSVYLVNSNDKLNEALLAWREYAEKAPNVALMAVIEERDMKNLSRLKFQRAQNRSLPMPIFRGDEDGTLDMVAKLMGLPTSA